MKKLSFILAAICIASTAQAENYFTFSQDGALQKAEIREGYGSARMGFELGGSVLVSKDCQHQGTAIACSFETANALQGKRVESKIELDGETHSITTEHTARGVFIKIPG